MGKYINTNWKVMVNSQDLSDHAFNVQVASDKERVEVSGFSTNGTREYLPGLEEQSITVSFLNDFGTNSVFQTIQPLYESGSAFVLYIQPDNSGSTSSANPVCRGSASVYSLPVAGELNARGELVVEFRPAPGSRFAWGTS